MIGGDDPLLRALRSIRGFDCDGVELPRKILELLMSLMSSASASLRHTIDGADAVHAGCAIEDGARLERHFVVRSGAEIIELTRPASTPFDARDALALEILGGEVVSRIEQHRLEAEANRRRRELDVLRALSRAGEIATRVRDVADRAASKVLGIFTGAHVVVHLVVEQELELIARRTTTGDTVDNAPGWSRLTPLDGPTSMALAARERRTVLRSIEEVKSPRLDALEGWGIRHVLSVPLSFNDALLGTLTVGHHEAAPWDKNALALVEEAAAQLGTELAQAQAMEAERDRADDLGVLNELGSLFAQHLELRAVLTTAAKALSRMSTAPRVHIFLVDETGEWLRGVAATEDDVADLQIPVGAVYAVGYAMRTRAPVVIEDAETDTRTNKELVHRAGTKSLAIVPLLAGGGAIGVIVLIDTRQKRTFAASEIARVVAVSNLLAPAVTNAQMFESLRRSYEALAKAQADVVKHERLAALGELSAVIAHEVRNPVAVIFNSLCELRRIAPMPSNAAPLLDIVGDEATRLNRIVGDLLDFVRPYEAHPRLVTVDSIMQAVIDAARRAAPERNIALVTDIADASREVFVDATMLQHALLNLVVNAMQATPTGKRVHVTARVVREPTSADADEIFRCEIVDEGDGIDDANAARIFEPFFTTKPTGTGLGLALVRRLADALEGTVVARRHARGGAEFVLTVPLRCERASQDDAPEMTKGPSSPTSLSLREG